MSDEKDNFQHPIPITPITDYSFSILVFRRALKNIESGLNLNKVIIVTHCSGR